MGLYPLPLAALAWTPAQLAERLYVNTSIAGARVGTKEGVSPSGAGGLDGAAKPPQARVSAAVMGAQGRSPVAVSPPLVNNTKSAATAPLVNVVLSVGTTGETGSSSLSKNENLLLPEIDINSSSSSFSLTLEGRYLLQEAARKWLPQHRVCSCFWWLARGAADVGVAYSSVAERARYLRLMVCGSVWACPVCAARITEFRAGEVRSALAALTGRGGSAGFATFTVSHTHEDALETVLGGFLAAFRAMTSWRGYKSLRVAYGVLGYVRVLEVTYGRNGWHVHVHVLYCFDQIHSQETLSEFEDKLYPLWLVAARKQGLTMSRQYGLQVKLAYGTVEEYLSKFGHGPRWDIAREMTRGHVKRGRSLAGLKHLTPWELLALAQMGDLRAGSLFAHFVSRFDGKAQLYWSPGLRALLLPAVAEVSDQDVAELAEPDEREVGAIDRRVWESVKRDGGRARVLQLVKDAGGDWSGVAGYLDDVVRRFPPFVPRDLSVMAPELRAGLDQLHADQAERNRWNGPLLAVGGAV